MRPKLVILGNEFKENENIRKIARLQSSRGCAIQFHAGEVQYASTQLLDSTESDLTQERRIIFEVACKRQGVNTEDMLRCIDGFCESRLIVLGDTIVDQYAACEALGMSAEAPVIVVKELEEKTFLGGAGIVAGHISSLGAKCDLISVVGQDATSEIETKLKGYMLEMDLKLILLGRLHLRKDMLLKTKNCFGLAV